MHIRAFHPRSEPSLEPWLLRRSLRSSLGLWTYRFKYRFWTHGRNVPRVSDLRAYFGPFITGERPPLAMCLDAQP